jgi:SPP1 gp7 family putative phage head morphogenesis protein
MIEFKPFRIPFSYEKFLEEKIKQIFMEEIFEPLVSILTKSQDFLIHNSIEEIRNALIKEKIFFNKVLNIFYSKKPYGSNLFKALQKLGGKLNKRTGNFEISFSRLPPSLQTIINTIDTNAIISSKKIIQETYNLSNQFQQKKDFSIYFYEAGEKFNTFFQEQYQKRISPIPVIKKEISNSMRDKISQLYSDDLNKYIQNFSQEEIKKIRIMVEQNVLSGYRSSSIKDLLIKEYGIAKTKAKMLARQETSLFFASLQEAEFREYGAKKFKWHTSEDEKVRMDHKVLNGKIFFWDNLPIIDSRTGERGMPGVAHGCRCTASAVFDFNYY